MIKPYSDIVHKTLSEKYSTKSGSFYIGNMNETEIDSELNGYKQILDNENIDSISIIPMFQEKEIIGFIELADKTPNTIEYYNVEIIESLAEKIGTRMKRLYGF